MPDEDDDLKLNTLNRFAKKSAKLALEEYSHCEVPAGCGGVVLRWTDPAEGKLALLMIAAVGTVAGFLDGKSLETGRALIGDGDHVLAIALEQGADLLPPVAPEAGGVLEAIANVLRPAPRTFRGADLVALVLAEDVGRLDRTPLAGVATAGDGTWRVLAADAAPDGWAAPGFDDRAWPALLAAGAGAVDRLPETDSSRWRFLDVERVGARALVLPASTNHRFWIRRAFHIVEGA